VNRIPLFDAKNRLSAVVHDVEAGVPVELTRHGKPVAVVMDSASYFRLQGEQRVFGRLFDRFLREWPPSAEEAAGYDEEGGPFAGIRSSETGRDVDR